MNGFYCALSAFAVMALGTVDAAVIPVTSTADSGAGSLRAALSVAMDGDTIDATGVSGIITLAGGQLVVTRSVTIQGPGPANLAVDGNASSRVFEVDGPYKIVAIHGFTITNGLAKGSYPAGGGAGIHNNHAALTVSNCIVTGNSATAGGGIFNDSVSGAATLKVVNSTISGNTGDNAGGIFIDAQGGNSTVMVVNSTVSGNQAVNQGGGIYNDATHSGVGNVAIVNSTISGNTGTFGGGIFNNGNDGSATLTVITSNLSRNTARMGGGGILNNADGTVMINGSTLSGNSAGDAFGGGGILNNGGGNGTVPIADNILNAGGSGANLLILDGTITFGTFRDIRPRKVPLVGV